jgi:hypothetical protein
LQRHGDGGGAARDRDDTADKPAGQHNTTAVGQGMIEALRASAGGWKGLIDAEELKRNIYADRLSTTRPEPKL